MTTIHLTFPERRVLVERPDNETIRKYLQRALGKPVVLHNTWPGPRLVVDADREQVEALCAEVLPAHRITWRCS